MSQAAVAERGSYSAVAAGAAAALVLFVLMAGETPIIQPPPAPAPREVVVTPLPLTPPAPAETEARAQDAPNVETAAADAPAPLLAMLAPAPEPASPGAPQWTARPSARDMARLYPQRALAAGIEGRVLLNCTLLSDGRLRCSVISETPDDYGFGRAALRIAERFRAEPQMENGRAVERANVGLPIQFVTGR